MGKQKRTLVPNHESFQRINYLYQAAHSVLRENPNNVQLIRFYCHTLKTIARKNVMRLDPTIKRNLCRKCCMLLLPGITATTRFKGKKGRHAVVTCLECCAVKRFVISANHHLWTDCPEAWVNPCPRHLSQNTAYGNSQCTKAKLETTRGSSKMVLKCQDAHSKKESSNIKRTRYDSDNKNATMSNMEVGQISSGSQKWDMNMLCEKSKDLLVVTIGTQVENCNKCDSCTESLCTSDSKQLCPNHESSTQPDVTANNLETDSEISVEFAAQMNQFLQKVDNGEKFAQSEKCHSCNVEDMQIHIPKKGYTTKNRKLKLCHCIKTNTTKTEMCEEAHSSRAMKTNQVCDKNSQDNNCPSSSQNLIQVSENTSSVESVLEHTV